MLLGSGVLLMYGALTFSFNFTFYGLAGYLVGDRASTDYSLIYLGNIIKKIL